MAPILSLMAISSAGERREPPHSPDLHTALLNELDSAVLACDATGRILFANRRALALWPTILAPPSSTPRFTDEFAEHALQRALAGEEVSGEWQHILTGDGRHAALTITARPLADGAMLSATEVRESPAEARLRTYVSDFEILTEVSRLLADVQDADEAAGIIGTVALGSTGAIAVMLWEADTGLLMLRWSEGVMESDALAALSAVASAGAERALVEGQTFVEHPAPSGTETPAGATRLPGTAWHEPLIRVGRPTGVLSIVWPGELTDTERPGFLAEALGHHAATALERSNLVRRLADAARTDPLTGLANRRAWEERLELELARAGREGTPISLIVADVDRFKSYNDRFGHPRGDGLLRETAAAWNTQLRETDLLARVGGEEFAVILPNCPLDDARLVAERLRHVVPRGETSSFGVALWDRAGTAFDLYAVADAALYDAKAAGRDRVCVGAPALRS